MNNMGTPLRFVYIGCDALRCRAAPHTDANELLLLCIHTLRWVGTGWDGLCCALRCDAMLRCVFHVLYMNIHT